MPPAVSTCQDLRGVSPCRSAGFTYVAGVQMVSTHRSSPACCGCAAAFPPGYACPAERFTLFL